MKKRKKFDIEKVKEYMQRRKETGNYTKDEKFNKLVQEVTDSFNKWPEQYNEWWGHTFLR